MSEVSKISDKDRDSFSASVDVDEQNIENNDCCYENYCLREVW